VKKKYTDDVYLTWWPNGWGKATVIVLGALNRVSVKNLLFLPPPVSLFAKNSATEFL